MLIIMSRPPLDHNTVDTRDDVDDDQGREKESRKSMDDPHVVDATEGHHDPARNLEVMETL
jgi:hypothetical protein